MRQSPIVERTNPLNRAIGEHRREDDPECQWHLHARRNGAFQGANQIAPGDRRRIGAGLSADHARRTVPHDSTGRTHNHVRQMETLTYQHRRTGDPRSVSTPDGFLETERIQFSTSQTAGIVTDNLTNTDAPPAWGYAGREAVAKALFEAEKQEMVLAWSTVIRSRVWSPEQHTSNVAMVNQWNSMEWDNAAVEFRDKFLRRADAAIRALADRALKAGILFPSNNGPESPST